MRKIFSINIKVYYYSMAFIGALLFWGCDSDNAWDCFQTSGPIVQRTFNVDKFKKIIIWNRVQLIVSSATLHSLVVNAWSGTVCCAALLSMLV